MASVAGVVQRARIILSALTSRSAELPIPVRDSTYYDAVRVSADGAGVAVASADLFTVLEPYMSGSAAGGNAAVGKFRRLCRDTLSDKNACEPDVGRLLYHLVRSLKPACVIEVGVYKGAASCHIAQALKDNHVTSTFHLVDISETFLAATRAQLEEFSLLESSVFHCGDASALAARGGLPRAEIIFLDGHHTEDSVRQDVESFWPLVKPDGLLLLHNSILWNGARTTVNRLAHRTPDHVATLATSGGSGISIVRKPLP